jgi:hypothetical protein
MTTGRPDDVVWQDRYMTAPTDPSLRPAVLGGRRAGRPAVRRTVPGPAPAEPEGRPAIAAGAAAAVLLAAASAAAAQLPAGGSTLPVVIAVAVVQVLLVACWYLVVRPSAPLAVTVVGVGVAVGCDGVAVATADPEAARFADVIGLAFAVVVILQLARGAARTRVTEALGATFGLVVAVAAAGLQVVLFRLVGGAAAVTGAMGTAGAAIGVAYVVDLVLPRPRIAPGVPRGVPGVLAGIAVGAVAGVLVRLVLGPPPAGAVGPVSTLDAILAGAAIGAVSVLVVLGIDVGRAGRVHAGEDAGRSPLRWVLGPAMGLAAASATAYVLATIGG